MESLLWFMPSTVTNCGCELKGAYTVSTRMFIENEHAVYFRSTLWLVWAKTTKCAEAITYLEKQLK